MTNRVDDVMIPFHIDHKNITILNPTHTKNPVIFVRNLRKMQIKLK